MEITVGSLTDLYEALRARFQRGVGEAQPPEGYAPFVTMLDSTTSIEQVPMGALLGDLERFVDEQHWHNMVRWLQEVQNYAYTGGFVIPRDNVADDQLGFFPQMTERLGRLAATHPYRNIPQLFIDGLTTAWVDGQNVWANAHNVGGWTFDNLDQQPLTQGGYRLVKQHLRERQGPEGEALNLAPTHLFCGPAYENRAKEIINRELIGQGSSNIHVDDVEVLVWSRFTGANAHDWGIADLSGNQVPPVVVTDREGPDLAGQTSPTSDSAIERREFRYVASRRYGTGVLCPWLVQYSRGQGGDPATTTTAA